MKKLLKFFQKKSEARRYLDAELWVLDNLEIADEYVEITGWAFPPDSPKVKPGFFLNDIPFDQVEYGIKRKPLGEHFWNRENAALSGFKCRLNIKKEEHGLDKKSMEIRYEYPGQPARYKFHYSLFLPPADGWLNLPDPARRFRVIGTENDEHFIRGGHTDFMRFRYLLKEVFKKDYSDFGKILDWGCGCGRVARYFSKVPGIEFHGADIDGDNVKWCSDNLKFGRFRQIPLLPPTDFKSDFFDLIYGISIFTHLKEDVQTMWLEELQRITATGAVLLMTVHGVTCLDYAGIDPRNHKRAVDRLKKEGFFVSSTNNQVEEQIDDKDYYVNVMHSHDYVKRVWGKYFKIIDIIPGFIFTHDLVIMQKR